MSYTPSVLPLLVVFSLDHILWPFWTEIDHSPPFKRDTSSGKVVDSIGRYVRHYEESPKALERVQKLGVQIAGICPTHEVDGVRELLDLFNWEKYFTYTQIDKEPKKITLIQRLHNETGINYSDMLLFDDSYEAVEEIGKLGVVTFRVMAGIELRDVEDGLKEFEVSKNSTGPKTG